MCKFPDKTNCFAFFLVEFFIRSTLSPMDMKQKWIILTSNK